MWRQAQAQIAVLQKVDPYFNEIGFLGEAGKTYKTALVAEGAMSPDMAASAASRHFRDHLIKRVSDWRAQSAVRHLSDVEFNSSVIFKIFVDGLHQFIMVRFTGTWFRYTASASSHAVIEGSKMAERFIEFATFVRPAGTTTPKSIAAGAPIHCPGCGAPVQPGSVVCPFCVTPLTGTGGTWLLDKVSETPYA